MKRIKTVGLVLLMTALLLSACGGFSFVVTTTGKKVTVEAKGPKEGDFVDSEPVTIGRGRVAAIESSLDKGKMKIEFVEVTVFESDDVDEPDTVIEGDVAYTVTVSASDKQTLELEEGEYIIRCTAEGSPNGKVEIRFEKQE